MAPRSVYAPEVVEGRVIAHRDGYGFLARDDGGEDVFLPAREMRGLMHGDRVACEVRISRWRGGRSGSRSGPRQRGVVLEVIERNRRVVVGRFFRAGGFSFVSPDHRNLLRDVTILDGEGTDGEMVVVELADPRVGEREGNEPAGRIVERLGDPERPGMAAEIAIRSHGIPHAWPEEAITEAERVPSTVPAAASGDRTDLRDLPLVTIDGADAKDFDDAVHCDPRPGGWKLTVAIADVSHYVPPGSALDREAAVRGTSVYFPGRVVPMLPERLSNGICSLNPEVDRLCLACEMHVDRRGRVTRAFFRDAVMRSRARLTYEEVEAAVFDGDAAARRRLGGLVPRLEALREVYAALRQARRRRGALDLEIGEPRVVLGSNGEVANVEPAPRRVSHQLIEECMLAANVAAARRLARSRAPFLYRVHPPPDEEGLPELGAFLGRAGIDFDPGEEPQPGAFSEAAERAAGRPDSEVLHLALLRAMAKADYRPRNIGHFGLALERYTHFTSPIRRYPGPSRTPGAKGGSRLHPGGDDRPRAKHLGGGAAGRGGVPGRGVAARLPAPSKPRRGGLRGPDHRGRVVRGVRAARRPPGGRACPREVAWRRLVPLRSGRSVPGGRSHRAAPCGRRRDGGAGDGGPIRTSGGCISSR